MSEQLKSNEENLVEVAGRINAHANSENDKFGIDPLTILTIIHLIVKLVGLINRCRANDKDIKRAFRRPGLFVRFSIKLQISESYPHISSGERKALYRAVLKESKEMSNEELDGIINYYKEMERKK